MFKKNKTFLFFQLLNSFLVVFLGKLVSVYVEPEVFGTYTLQFSIYTLVFSLFIGPSIQFFKVEISDTISEVKSAEFLVLFSCLIFCSFLFFLFLSMFSFEINSFLLFVVFFTLIINLIFNLSVDYLTIKGKLLRMTYLNSAKNLFTITFFSFFVMFSSVINFNILWGVNLLGFIVSIVVFSDFSKIKFNQITNIKFFFKKNLIFVWPLVLLSFFSWVNNYFDRYVIDYFLNTESVGVYSANYSLGSKFFLLLSPVFLSVLTPKIYSDSSIEKKTQDLKKTIIVYFAIGFILLFFIFHLKDFIGSVFLSNFYKDGFFIIFWAALGFLFFTASSFYDLLLYKTKKTKQILVSNIFSSLVNVLLNILLIDSLGIFGAILSTVVSFLIKLLYSHYVIYKIKNRSTIQ